MELSIYQRKEADEKVTMVTTAFLQEYSAIEITFVCEDFLPVSLGLLYYVKIESPEGSPEECQFQEISFANNLAVRPPYTYTAQRGEKWIGNESKNEDV